MEIRNPFNSVMLVDLDLIVVSKTCLSKVELQSEAINY